MKAFRRALFACAVAGPMSASGCVSPQPAEWPEPAGVPAWMPRAQLPARAAPAIPEPEWNGPAQPDAGSSAPLPQPLATVEWTSPGAVPPPPAPAPTRPVASPDWIAVPAPPVVVIERGN